MTETTTKTSSNGHEQMTEEEARLILAQPDPSWAELTRIRASFDWEQPVYKEATALAMQHPAFHEAAMARAVEEETKRLRTQRDAKRALLDEEMAEAQKNLRLWKGEEFSAEPAPEPIIDSVLAAEVNLIGGPTEAGKSLLARDFCLSVASGQPWHGHAVKQRKDIVWVASEGLHDFGQRWASQDLWEAAKARVHVVPDPINLVGNSGTDWLLSQTAGLDLGLVVFDVIYGMGMGDDNGVKDALPVINNLKRISAETGAGTVALGHPPHDSKRRFRGTSMWRQLAYVEWHMADGLIDQQKSKIGSKEQHRYPYDVDYPDILMLSKAAAGSKRLAVEATIQAYLNDNPDASDRQAAEVLAPSLSRSPDSLRKVVAKVRKETADLLEMGAQA